MAIVKALTVNITTGISEYHDIEVTDDNPALILEEKKKKWLLMCDNFLNRLNLYIGATVNDYRDVISLGIPVEYPWSDDMRRNYYYWKQSVANSINDNIFEDMDLQDINEDKIFELYGPSPIPLERVKI